jgi:exopolysaccharide biosynthesis protein
LSDATLAALFLLVGVLFTAVTSVVVTVIASRQKATSDLVTELRAELTETRALVIAADARIAALERRDRAWANYVHRLRRHITDQLPPPPPEWPEDLDR